MVGKPKGGRGKKAPYHTKLMRVPEPIAAQVEALGLRYQEFIVAGGDSANPPFSWWKESRNSLMQSSKSAQERRPLN
jgi:hypothetical protein